MDPSGLLNNSISAACELQAFLRSPSGVCKSWETLRVERVHLQWPSLSFWRDLETRCERVGGRSWEEWCVEIKCLADTGCFKCFWVTTFPCWLVLQFSICSHDNRCWVLLQMLSGLAVILYSHYMKQFQDTFSLCEALPINFPQGSEFAVVCVAVEMLFQ